MADADGTSIGKRNLKSTWAAPSVKVAVAAFAILLGLVGWLAYTVLQNSQKAGVAQADRYGTSTKVPRGGVADKETVATVQGQGDEAAKRAREVGESYQAPFIFEVERAPKLLSRDGVDELSQETSKFTEEQVFAGLRDRSSVLDRTEAEISRASNGAAGNTHASSNSANPGPAVQSGSGGGAPQRGTNTEQMYGVTQKDAEQIAGQLLSVGTLRGTYASLPDGVLSMVATAKPVSDPTNSPVVLKGSGNGKTKIVAKAGDICAASPEAAINTDFQVPVFFELLECGELTGSKARGMVQKGADDFVIAFSDFFPPRNSKLKFKGIMDGVSVNISKDGVAGVADDVNRHWPSRIAAAALQNLARTERQMLQNRGSTTTWGVGGSTTSYDRYSSQERRDARVAGVVEGAIDVVTRDAAYSVNRPATMTLNRSTAIGIQFLRDVEVTYED